MKTEFAAPSTIVSAKSFKPLMLACLLASAAVLGAASVVPAQAQVAVSINFESGIANQEWADPPGRVGRLSYLSGDVSFFGDNQEGWARGRLNYPVSNENSVWTGRGGRAEFRVGAQSVRVDEETVLDVLNLTDNATVLFLQRGVVNVRVRDFNRGDSFWIDTAEGRLAIRGNGRFRVEADTQTGETRFTTFSGSARVEVDGVQRSLERGTALTVRGGAGIGDSRYERSFETNFDRWSNNRDRDDDFSYSRVVRDRVVSPYMTGYEELNAHGDWLDDNEYGRIWAPRITNVSWAPYRYGHWTYARRWGWTWVDDSAWGFAPFHYGRWLFTSNRWCWSPGSYVHRPVYAPALVGWHGNFSHNNHGGRGGHQHGRDPLSNALNGRGAVGWFPLSPYDRFEPSYTSNQNYVRNVNSGWVNRVRSPGNAYQNHTPGATFVARDVFLNASPITTQATISAAEIMRGGVSANSFSNTFTTAAPSLLPGRFRGNGDSGRGNNTPVQGNNPGAISSGTLAPTLPANNGGFVSGRPNMQPAQPLPVQPGLQFQPRQPQQPQTQPQPVGRPTAADIMRGGVSLAPTPAAAPAVPAQAPIAPNQSPQPSAGAGFGNMGSRPTPQPAIQPTTQPPVQNTPQPAPQPMPLPGREMQNQNNQGISSGRFAPFQPAMQPPQQPVIQPSAPVYSRPGYSPPVVAPAPSEAASAGSRRGTYSALPQGAVNAPQRPTTEINVAPKSDKSTKSDKAERENKQDEPKQRDNRGPVRGTLEKQP